MTQEYEPADEVRIAVGGAFDRRAGCLLTPLIPVRAAGALIVTATRVIFEPILHYKLVARKVEYPLDEIESVDSQGGNVGINFSELVTFGKNLRIRLKSGKVRTYRSMQADELAAVINEVKRRRLAGEGLEGGWEDREGGQ